jgi:two-component system OmpR family response regulator
MRLIRREADRGMSDRSSVLIVEDDADIGDLISRYLQNNAMDVALVGDGVAMDDCLSKRDFDILILDLNLPGEDGLSICRRVRATRRIPIIIVTAKGEDVDKILGLEMGADDYIVKPFNSRELLARIRAVLRRAETQGRVDARAPRQAYHFHGWRLDLLAREVVSPQGTKVAMTGAEFDLLHALCDNPNRVLTRDQLIGMTHGPTSGPFERSIDVLISRLRQKLEKDPRNPAIIQTIRSEGYMLSAPVTRL